MSRPTKPPRSWSWTTTLLVLALAAGTTRCATTPQSSPQPPGPPPAATLTLRVEVADLEAYKTFHADTLGVLPQVASITSHISLGSSKDLRG